MLFSAIGVCEAPLSTQERHWQRGCGKAGYSQPLASGELTSCKRWSPGGMAKMITAEPRQPLTRDAYRYA